MRFVAVCLSVLLLFASAVSAQARTESIAVVVNEGVITQSDVLDRMSLIIASSGLPNTEEIRSKLAPQIISSLVEEELKLQEAKRLDIKVEPEEIETGFAAIAQQNNSDPQQFKTMLRRGGLNLRTMERQIKSQIAWAKIIQQKMRPQIDITDSDIDEVISRLQGDKGKVEYLLAEIALPVDDPEQENDIRQLADRLARQIKSGEAPFNKVAQQFSKSAGAAQGGDLGWVQASQLQQQLAEPLSAMQKGEISDPVRSLNGYHILYVRDVRQISDESIPPREQITNSLGMERLDRLQRRYLLDLKAAAFIESRV